MSFYPKLKAWYALNQRDLPWRTSTDPYTIWVSEIILQQTRIDQGMPYFERFMERFPDVASLAKAPEDELLRVWQGLGYYSRAINMHRTAKIVFADWDGQFPTTFKELQLLPGIGTYTAAAIASFCFGEAVPVLDGNVYRFFARYWGLSVPVPTTQSKKIFTEKLQAIIPQKEPATFNQAIMEFGSLYCKKDNPSCDECMFAEDCVAYNTGKVSRFPVKKIKPKQRLMEMHYFCFFDGKEILVKQRDDSGIWKRLFELPGVEGKDWKQRREFQTLSSLKPVYETKHMLSHIAISASFYLIDNLEKGASLFSNSKRISIHEINNLGFSQLMIKFFKQADLYP